MSKPLRVADVTHYTDRAGRVIRRRYLSPAVMERVAEQRHEEAMPTPMGNAQELAFQVRLVTESLSRVSERRAGLIRDLYLPGEVGVDSAFMALRCVTEHTLELKPGSSVVVSTALAIKLANPDAVGVITTHPFLTTNGILLKSPVIYLEPDDQTEIVLALHNHTVDQTVLIQPGEPVAQYTVVPRFKLKPDFVSWFT